MNLQDLIFALGSIVFIFSLIPSVVSPNKPDLKTSLPTAIILFVFAITYITLSLYFAAATTFITASLWLTLFIQKRKENV